MRNPETVVIDMLNPFLVEQPVHLDSVVASSRSWNRRSPTSFSSQNETRSYLEVLSTLGGEKIRAIGFELSESPIHLLHIIVEPVKEHGSIPRSGIPEELGIGQYQAERSPSTLAEAEKEPAFRRSHRRIMLLDKGDDEFLEAACLPSL